MFKKIVCLTLSFILVTSFFVMPVSAFDINDYIESDHGDIPSVDTDVELFDNKEDNNSDSEDYLNLNEEYYNEDHLVEEEKEPEDNFDTKTELHTVENPASAAETNNDDIQSYSLRSEAVEQSEDYGIMPLADEEYEFEFPDISVYSNWTDGGYYDSYAPVINKDNAYYAYKYGFALNDSTTFIETFEDMSWLFTNENLIILKSPVTRTSKYKFDYVYTVIWCDKDINVTSGTGSISANGDYTFFQASVTYCTYKKIGYFAHGCRYYFNEKYSKPVSGFLGFQVFDTTEIVYSGGHKIFIDDVELESKYDEDGFIKGDIKGDFSFSDKSKILTYKAWSDKKLDNTYDVHLFALDNPNVPPTLTGAEDFPIVDLENYQENKLQLSPDKSSVQASYELEAVYYYLHQMKGYDDSLESVDGYNFTEFESRENLNFAIAYREKNNVGYWTVCKSYQYNYEDLINNVIGEFTIKKDYVDFPSIDDYIKEFPSINDFLPEGEDPGPLDYILAFLKFIIACLLVIGHNFIGFFKWIFACIPILWDNLTIALYNLVCDLKSLALYLFNPKSRSIMAMVDERIPGLTQFVNAIQNKSTADLPSYTFFGYTFTLDLTQYDLPWHYLKSFSQVLIMIMFDVGTYNLVAHVFGFVKLSGVFDSPTDSDGFEYYSSL